MASYTLDLEATGPNGQMIVESAASTSGSIADQAVLIQSTGVGGSISLRPDNDATTPGNVNFFQGQIQFGSQRTYDFDVDPTIASDTIVAKIETNGSMGANAFSLADGDVDGQRMVLLYYIEGDAADTAVITPDTTGGSYTNITLADVGDTAEVTWQADVGGDIGWYLTGGTVVGEVGGTGTDNFITTWNGTNDIDDDGKITLDNQEFKSVGASNTDVTFDTTGTGGIILRPQKAVGAGANPYVPTDTGGFIHRFYVATFGAGVITLRPDHMLGGMIRGTANAVLPATTAVNLPLTADIFIALNAGTTTTVAEGDAIDFYIVNLEILGDSDFRLVTGDGSTTLIGNQVIPGASVTATNEMQSAHFRWIVLAGGATAECWRLS